MTRATYLTSAIRMASTRFLADRRGNVALTFAVSAFAIFGAMGAAYDYSNSQRYQTQVQNALDAAVLAAILDSPDFDEQISAAKKFYFANLPNQYPINTVPLFSHDADGNLVGNITGSVATTLLGIVGKDKIKIFANATAGRGAKSRVPMCFMAMHPKRKHTLELKDSVSVYGPNCHIYGNSDHPYDVVDPHTLNNFITSASIQAIGYGHHFIQNLTPPLEYAPELIPDPFLAMTLPSPGSCDHSAKKIKGGTATLSPGTYCGGLRIENGADVIMNSGLYILKGGEFKIKGSTLKGTGVTIMLGVGAKIKWEDSEVILAAQTSGPYTSFVVMGERINENHSFKKSTVDLHGIVYLPNGAFDWENKDTPTITADWTAWIIDGVTWRGTGTVNLNWNTKDSSVPYPKTLNIMPRSAGDKTVRLFD